MLFYRYLLPVPWTSAQVDLHDIAPEEAEFLADDFPCRVVCLAQPLQFPHAFLGVAVTQAVGTVGPAQGTA